MRDLSAFTIEIKLKRENNLK